MITLFVLAFLFVYLVMPVAGISVVAHNKQQKKLKKEECKKNNKHPYL